MSWNKKSVVIDIDGVAADFTLGFTKWAHDNLNKNIAIVPSRFHQHWDFKGIMSPQETNYTWEYINRHPDWWGSLALLIPLHDIHRLNAIHRQVPVYFVTNRPDDAQRITNDWLIQQGFHYPNVILSKKKGEVARLLHATHAIDDKIENVWCLHWISDEPQTKVYILDRPYNSIDNTHTGPHNIIRVSEFSEFLNDLELAYK